MNAKIAELCSPFNCPLTLQLLTFGSCMVVSCDFFSSQLPYSANVSHCGWQFQIYHTSSHRQKNKVQCLCLCAEVLLFWLSKLGDLLKPLVQKWEAQRSVCMRQVWNAPSCAPQHQSWETALCPKQKAWSLQITGSGGREQVWKGATWHVGGSAFCILWFTVLRKAGVLKGDRVSLLRWSSVKRKGTNIRKKRGAGDYGHTTEKVRAPEMCPLAMCCPSEGGRNQPESFGSSVSLSPSLKKVRWWAC